MTELKPEANETDVLSNQTSFFEEELLVQTPPSMPVEVDPDHAEKLIVKKKRQRQLILAGTGSVVVLLFLIAGVVLFMPETVRQLNVVPTPIAIGQTPAETNLTRRLDELEADLRSADPIKVNAPFPPLNLTTIYLDAPPR